MKRFLALALAVLMLLTMAACGKEAPKEDTPSTTTGNTTTNATDGDTTTTTTAEGDTTTGGDDTTTEGSATTTGGTKAPTKTGAAASKTSTTKKTTSTTSGKGEEVPAIRVLAIGDNGTVDAVEKHLYEMLKSAGYKTIHLGILYADKSTIDTHYTAVKNDSKTYEFRLNDNGTWKKHAKVAPSAAFLASEWDYVVLQQGTADAGMPATYGKLGDLLKLIKKQCDAEIYWHMTWAYRRGCADAGFKNYKNSEREMYQSIVSTTLKHVMGQSDIGRLIPTATAIQNLRTTALRDDLTTDGARLGADYGAYAAALTWYAVLTDESADTVTYRPATVKSQFATLAEAANNAVNTPQQVTAATDEIKDLKILSIGHSFSLDAMRTYMWDLFDAAGYNVTIGYLYYPSCSLEQHYHYISDNSPSYEQYGKNSDGKWVTQSGAKATDALWDEDWDIVTFQPDPDFGYDKFLNNVKCYCQWGCNKNIESDYLHFDELVDEVLAILADPKNPNGPNTDVKLYYHLTWTWRQDCWLGEYLYPKGYDQLTLYQDFIDATKKKVLTNKNILGVIPCNTSIENARTTWMGDTFNAEASNDGYHLNDKGDLAAALTWVSYFTGIKASNIYVDTITYSERQIAAIAEAVDNAIAHPYEVTESTYKKEK